ncbi:MAG TPA: chemotaxis response regulator protein-glutamate methylesterase [Planctomycetota bacterium]|nr:chemotaxis response regulator protein-glutamate methylesterase [Planctomycetota bacterium]
MRRIRTLVVDDSATIRKIVCGALRFDPEIEVVGEAADGREALAQIESTAPDAVTLDIEMPVMDGLEALREIRRTRPRLAVIMFSTRTERGAVATLDALALGADDYVTKPSGAEGLPSAVQKLRDELIPRIKELCRSRVARAEAAERRAPPPAPPEAPRRVAPRPAQEPFLTSEREIVGGTRRADLVALAASTGGPSALTDFFRALPRDLAAPILVAQHMPPLFTRLLAERLAARTGLDVREAVDGERLLSGMARIAPGDRHLVVRRERGAFYAALTDDLPEHSCRPAADPLFRSLAAAAGPNALCVLLTGMGRDGCDGARSVRAAGGAVVAQDEASSVVWGMPGAVVRAGLADEVLPLSRIPLEVQRRVAVGRSSFPLPTPASV